ncbi:MAG: 2OG-Fe(II) oxygenase [Myxococcota bacterium]|nr:2OG-Fe(II) oxygenase [Myxococcota bacterium]
MDPVPGVMRKAEVAPFFFDRSALVAVARAHASGYRSAAPFAHTVIDGLFPREVLDRVVEEFPSPRSEGWERYDDPLQKKLGSRDEERVGASTRLLLHELNSAPFVQFLEELTGISGLVPDPWFEGGGLHQIERGGMLKVHVDFNKHTLLGLDRRINVLIYLNEDWDEAWGGHLELWDTEMKRAERRIAPRFNRMVVFNTTDFANHGHPDPLQCPEHRQRRSLALYYYSNGRPASEVAASHTTIFKRRPGETIPRTLNEIGENLLPPVVLDAIRRAGFVRSRK